MEEEYGYRWLDNNIGLSDYRRKEELDYDGEKKEDS